MEHFPAAETSPEVTTNEGSGGSAFGRERLHVGRDEAEGAWRARRGMAASRAVRNAAARGRAAGREERAAVRIQAFYRGYLVRTPSYLISFVYIHDYIYVQVQLLSRLFRNSKNIKM